MARYDRIARLDPPERDDAFTGWLALRDLQDDERDKDLGRRARLRFLAIRLVHRLTRRSNGRADESLRQQCDAAREELGQLPGRDPERQRLAEFLTQVSTLEPATVVDATLELADALAADGSTYAAEECYRAAIDLADACELGELHARALRDLTELGSGRGTAARS